MSDLEPWRSPAAIAQSTRILASYRRWLGRDLLPPAASAEESVRALFEAPFVVLAHGTEADPILNYGNRVALELWETDWAALTRMPSRLTAEPALREDRAMLLADVLTKGFSEGYKGVRVSRTGKRFRIERATVWNLLDENGKPAGQAATFNAWVLL
ncbi:MAG: MEKHLA domain-containing protein [Planctomycetes bacterium]|nr:MEKHLA domain-containing protein [Planctomycetota bacterium]